MVVTIRPGTCRDLCFIAANLRHEDRREIFASAMLASATEAAMLSWYSSGPDWSWTAWLDDQPQAAFGISFISPLQPHMRSAWLWGGPKTKQCIPAITRFTLREWPTRLLNDGVTRVEARSLDGHDLAAKWLLSVRARHETAMEGYGVNGETFHLYSWCASDWMDSH